jgi:hypothetical protein
VFPGALALLALVVLGPLELLDNRGGLAEDFRVRLSPLAFLVLPLAVRLPRGRWPSLLALAALTPLCAWRLIDVGQLHERHYARAAELVRELIDPIPEYSRVRGLWLIPEEASPRGDDRFRQLVNYVVILRHGYSSGVFAVPGQQALRHRWWGPNLPDRRTELSDAEWSSFDFVLLYDRGVPIDDRALASRGTLVATTGNFCLYKLHPVEARHP